MKVSRYSYYLSILCIVASCATVSSLSLDVRYGKSNPRNLHTLASSNEIDYWRDIKPILDSRCVVCHACLDAPCQLNLSAPEGIFRGAHPDLVYDGTRLIAAEPTRLFVDADSVLEWRGRGFFPVINERMQGPETNLALGVMANILRLKQQNPLPTGEILPDSFDFSMDGANECPSIEEFDVYRTKHPLWGMPYGFPALRQGNHERLLRWLEQGAPVKGNNPLDEKLLGLQQTINEWETFLNGDTLKQQLMSRYLYEHLFLANLYFKEHAGEVFFKLVRSKSPPSQRLEIINTVRPYDDPGISNIYYRLTPVRSTILAKTNVPYELSKVKMARFRELFLADNYIVTNLPGYAPDTAANPFKTFMEIPVQSRYRFLLDDAYFFMMGFIKGPVCRGQVALNVINDQFWVFFVNPDNQVIENFAGFLARESRHLSMPSEEQSNAINPVAWLKYSEFYNDYLQARIQYLNETLPEQEDINLGIVWDGDGWNDNSAITVFRHLNSGSVVKGMVGAPPKTALLFGYSLLERVHYLLVAGFDVYGNVGHQLATRLFMDFLRMEGEFNFLSLLPLAARTRERDFWYRGAHLSALKYIAEQNGRFFRETGIAYNSDSPKHELYNKIRARLGAVLNNSHDLENISHTDQRVQLQRLAEMKGEAVSFLPELSFLSISDESDPEDIEVVSLLHNVAHTNISSLFLEERRLLPEEDTLTVAFGFVGAHPNAFFHVEANELEKFVTAVEGMQSERDYRRLMSTYGVRRNSTQFWSHSDRLTAKYSAMAPIESGRFDYSRFENR